MNELHSFIGDNSDESPCTWLESSGMWLGASLSLICIALVYFGPDVSNLIFH